MNAITSSRLDEIAETVKTEHALFETAMRESLAHAVTAGALLTEAKQLVKHGEWGKWIADNCQFGERTAQNYMRIADRYPELAKAQPVADLTYREAVGLLAEPKNNNDYDAEMDEIFQASQTALDAARERLQDNDLEMDELVKILHAAQELENGWRKFNIRNLYQLGRALNTLEGKENGAEMPWWYELEPHKTNACFPMDESVIDMLADDMRRNGYMADCPPITLFENKVLDGKLRLEAARRANVTPHFEIFNGDEQEALNFAIRRNGIRKNLTETQRAMVIVGLEELQESETPL